MAEPASPLRAPRAHSGSDETHADFIRSVLSTTAAGAGHVKQLAHLGAEIEDDADMPDFLPAAADAEFQASEEHTIRVCAPACCGPRSAFAILAAQFRWLPCRMPRGHCAWSSHATLQEADIRWKAEHAAEPHPGLSHSACACRRLPVLSHFARSACSIAGPRVAVEQCFVPPCGV